MPRTTKGSVLGKRSHHSDSVTSTSERAVPKGPAAPLLLNTPESSPCAKRLRTSTCVYDAKGNKENIPPFDFDDDIFSTSSSSRALHRSSSETTPPSSHRSITRRCGSMSNINSAAPCETDLASLAIQTPPATPATTPPLYKRIRALLRPTCDDSNDFLGRESESATLRDFLTSFVGVKQTGNATVYPVLYISGSPGCGKTALVNKLLSSYEEDFAKRGIRVCFMNCMAIKSLDAVWDRIIADFGNPKRRGKRCSSSERVEELFTSCKTKYVLVLDEVDHVATSSHVLSKLFGFAHKYASTLRVISIANTHTLTSSSQLSPSGISGVKTLHFAPYESSQLLKILNARFHNLSDCPTERDRIDKFLPPATLKLLSMKVASQTGDVRAVFEVLRRAIDIAIEKGGVSSDVLPPVTPAHIQVALKAYAPASLTRPVVADTRTGNVSSSSEMATKIRNLGLHARLALLAIVLASKRVEAALSIAGTHLQSPTKSTPRSLKRAISTTAISSENTSIDISQLHSLYIGMLTRGENEIFTPVLRSEFTDLLNVLETVGLIVRPAVMSPTPKRKLSRTQSFGGGSSKAQEIALAEGIRATEVLRCLGIEAGVTISASPDRLQEETGAIWTRELHRIRKETAASPKKAGRTLGLFDDAEQD